MGRAPCCDKVGLKKGPWTPEEDQILISFIHQFGHSNWRALPKQAGLLRCGKSCRLRWMNYLRPDIKRGNFTKEEEDTIIQLHEIMGNRWSAMAARLPGRTDNEIKNVWHTHLKKKLKQCQTTKPKPEMAATTHRKLSHTNENFVTTISNETTSAGTSYQIVPTSQQSYTTSDDFSSFTEVSSLQESNNAHDHANIKDNDQIFDTRQSDMDYLPIIDDTFWSHEVFHNNGSLDMPSTFSNNNDDNQQWQSQFSNVNASMACNNFSSMYDGKGPENYGNNMDFWYDIFLTNSSALEF